VRLLYPTYPR